MPRPLFFVKVTTALLLETEFTQILLDFYLTGGQEAVSSSLATRTSEKPRKRRNLGVFGAFSFSEIKTKEFQKTEKNNKKQYGYNSGYYSKNQIASVIFWRSEMSTS